MKDLIKQLRDMSAVRSSIQGYQSNHDRKLMELADEFEKRLTPSEAMLTAAGRVVAKNASVQPYEDLGEYAQGIIKDTQLECWNAMIEESRK